MTTKNTFCILLNPDINTQKGLASIHRQLIGMFPGLINSLTGNGDKLPYHKTIIGGIKLETDYSAGLIKGAVKELLVFENRSKLPKIKDLEAIQLPNFSIGVRLKFVDGSYIITGAPERNHSLAKSLGAGNFDFNLSHHITVCNVKGGYAELDRVLPVFEQIFLVYKNDLMQMTFTPEVWQKADKGWVKYNL